VAERKDPDREVLTSLPRSRPTRRSAKRGPRGDVRKPGAKTPAAKAAADVSAVTKRAATTKAKPKAKPKSAPKRAAQPRTAPERKVPPAGYAAPASRADDGAASGPADLLSTTIQAAAELAQIGLTVGRQTLRSMLERLPKP
jgi:hypothetical protein